MIEKLTKYRRDLHKIPELGYQEYKTKEYILSVLKDYNCEITELCDTAVCAYFKGQGPVHGSANRMETLAFRSDMDGLPVSENTGAEYGSCHQGKMHACGHDGHMAMLLGLAGQLHRNLQRLSFNVLLIFQPAEESPGGAKCICESGILSRYDVKKIYGFHLWPMMERHRIASRERELMAMASELDITIKGLSAHCAKSEDGIDALFIGCQLVNELYAMVDTEVPEGEFKLLKFGTMSSGRVRNTISDHTRLEGSLRSFKVDTFNFIMKRMVEIAKSYENKYGCTINISYAESYPPVINDGDLFRNAKNLLKDFDFTTFKEPFLLAEDFSYYQQEVPGLFMFLGTGTGIPLHSSNFDFDESILDTGVKAYMRLLGL